MTLWFLAAFAVSADALPVYRKMVRQTVGRPIACTLCHEPKSWELTGFGEAFRSEGRDLAAVEKAAGGDLDGDGFGDLEELQAGASPIDPGSTPKAPGTWLDRQKPLRVPERRLRQLLPAATGYAVVEEGRFDGASTTLRDEERLQIYFDAYAGGSLVGSATYATTDGPIPMVAFFAIDATGKVVGVLNAHEGRPADPKDLSDPERPMLRAVRSAAQALAERHGWGRPP